MTSVLQGNRGWESLVSTVLRMSFISLVVFVFLSSGLLLWEPVLQPVAAAQEDDGKNPAIGDTQITLLEQKGRITIRTRTVVPTRRDIPSEKRFVDNRDGTITDLKTGLMWIKNGWRIDRFSAVTWSVAVDECGKLREGGYRDWRLPSIQEWKSLIDIRNQCPALVEPNPFENIVVKYPYWSKTEFTYLPQDVTTASPLHAYTVFLYYGDIGRQRKDDKALFLPVRSLKRSELIEKKLGVLHHLPHS